MKRFLAYTILLLVTSVHAMAQTTEKMEITTLDWNTLAIDSLLPVYYEVVPLESDYTLYDYNVTIDYPEYGELTKAETEKVAKFDSQIKENIEVETYVGVQRRQGMLDISFMPIIKRDGKYMKLLSAQIIIHNTAKKNVRAVNSKSSRYANNSRLREGRWVKISITEDGMYRLSATALRNMGFSNPQNVHLYGYGGHEQKELIQAATDYDDLQEVPLYYSSATDSWLFWGNGLIYWDGDKHVINHFANSACYFLHEEGTPSGIQTSASSTNTVTQTVSTYRAHALHEVDNYAWYHGGRNLVEDYSFKTSSKSYRLDTPDVASSNVSVNIVLTAYSSVETKVTPNINGENVATMSIPKSPQYYYAGVSNKTYTNMGARADWTIKIPQTSIDTRLDYIAINYDRRLKPLNGAVAFTSAQSGTTRFDIEGSGLVVMKANAPKSPARIINGTQNGGTYSIVVDNPKEQYVAFNPAYNFPEPQFEGEIANQDLHSLPAADMVIIIPANGKLYEQAQRLAEAHLQWDNLKTHIVRADQIYNEFSSGTPDATAYRRFMKMLYDRADNMKEAPKYLLLMGDCAWDNRMLTSQWRKYNQRDYLLCYESEESYSDTKSYVMEDYFGLLDDGEGADLLRNKTDLGIGRFPIISIPDAKNMVDKCLKYITKENAGSWKNLVYILGDDGDENEHMKFADQVAENVKYNNPEMEVRKVMWDSYTRVSTTKSDTYPEVSTLLKKAMTDGAMVINYTGHSATFGLSHEYVLVTDDFKQAKGTKLPLWVTCSCDAMPFDGTAENVGETAIRNPNGAALAFYGTARTVYASQNLRMNQYFMKRLFGTDNNGERNRLGDAIRLAKSDIISGGMESTYKENKLQYALLGDPALMIGAPLERVILDSINGEKVSGYSFPQIKAGQKITLQGHMEDNKGNELTDFNGVLTTRLYDSEEEIVCHNNDGAAEAFTYKDRINELYEAQDNIVDGKFTLNFVIPIDINYSDEIGRLVFYAIDDKTKKEANGYNESFTLGGIVDDLTFDEQGPKITCYLNDEDFENGGTVNATPYFVANIQDESGINANGNGIGHNLELRIDGRADKTYILDKYYTREFGDYTRGSVGFNIPKLEAGPHTLTFRAWDILNHTNQTSLDFVVDPALTPDLIQLAATRNPAETETTFLIYFDLPGSECTFTIEVFDFMGQCMWRHTETGYSNTGTYSIPYTLTNGSGGKLGSGIYFYRCLLQSGDSKQVSKTQKLIVVNNK